MVRSTFTASAHWLAQLAALDRGELRAALQAFQADRPSDDPAHELWRAELLVYLDRLNEAEAALQRVAPARRDLVNRAELIVAEIALWRGVHEVASEQANATAARVATSDMAAYSRARLLVARAAVRRGDYREALRGFDEIEPLLEQFGLGYQLGILLHCRAYCHLKLTRVGDAEEAFARALAYLDGRRIDRWAGLCHDLHGLFLAELRQSDEAEREFRTAERIADELGLVRSVLWARNNRANLLLSLGRFGEAVDALGQLIDWERRGLYGFVEANSLLTLSLALGLLDRFEEAKRAGGEAHFVAAMLRSADLELDARILLAWASARAGDAAAIEDLRDALELANGAGTEQQRFKARLCLADCLVALRPDEAVRLVQEASASPEALNADVYPRLLPVVRKRMAESPVRIGTQGEFIVDPHRCGFPNFFRAVEALERYLVDEAMVTSCGNKAKAGRLLGLERYTMHDLWSRTRGLPTRPNRTGASGAVRRRASRKKKRARLD
jgi:tetratricopeptide (TPR) repeat protein